MLREIVERKYLDKEDFANSKSWYDDRNDYTSYYDDKGKEYIALSTDFLTSGKAKGRFEMEAPSGAVVYMTIEDCTTSLVSRYN